MAFEPMPHDGASRVCVRVPNWVGDVVMATPTFRAIRAYFPSAHVCAVARVLGVGVLTGAPWFDEVIAYDPSGTDHGVAARSFMTCVRRLRRGRYELGFVLPNSFSSALMMRLAGVRRRTGYARDARSPLLSDPLPRPRQNGRFKPTYMVDYYLGLCRALGIPDCGTQMELPFRQEDAERADEVLERQGIARAAPLVLLHPGAGYGPAKRWPAERFARVAGELQAELGARVALVAGSAERPIVEDIMRQAPVPVVDLTDCSIDLHLLKCVVARSRLLVTTDSGPRHYGVALGIPTVCIMGPNHPGYSTSDRPNDHLVRVDVDCGPCQKKVCPLDHRCMQDISVDMVLAACRCALEASAEGKHDRP